MAATYEVLRASSSLVTGALDCVLLSVWTGIPPRTDDIRACSAAVLTRAKELKRCGMIVAIHPFMSPPDDRVRKVIMEEVRQIDPYMICGATVISRVGLMGVAIRAFMSTAQRMLRLSHPERFVPTGADAVKYVRRELCQHIERVPEYDAIMEAYGQITQQAWRDAD